MSTACEHAIRLLTVSEMDGHYWLRTHRLGGDCAVAGCDKRPLYAESFKFQRRDRWIDIEHRGVCFEHAKRYCITYGLMMPMRFAMPGENHGNHRT